MATALMHLDREQVERALDSGLRAHPELQRHLESCPECQGRLDQARREEAWIRERLAVLDHASPPVSARSIITRHKHARRSWERVAAAVFLAVAAAGVAYAAPGSPLPGLLRRVVEQMAPTPSPKQAPPMPEARESQAGIAVPPGDRLTIEFASPQPGDTAVVSLTDAAEVAVRATGGTTTFVSEVARLTIRHTDGPARFEIHIPREAPSVELKVREHSILVKRKSGVTAGIDPDRAGRYLLPLAPLTP